LEIWEKIIKQDNEEIVMKDLSQKEKMIAAFKTVQSLSFPKQNRSSFVPICLSSDANYEPHLWVTIASIIDNAKSDKKYHIYILDGGIKNKDNFYRLIEKDNRFSIEFIDMRDQFVFAYESRHLSKAAYYRLAIFKLFKNLGKIIYLDADSYVLGDIAELYSLPMGKKLISGARDSITYEIPWREKYIEYENYSGKALNYYKNYLLKNKPLESYFSSGVLVFNLKDTDLNEKQNKLDTLVNNNYFSHDQDILNLLYTEKETYPLPREWNYFNSALTLKSEDFCNEEEKENYIEGKVEPKIISYVLKPWLKENLHAPYANLYWDKISQSPYYEEIKRNSLKNSKLERFKKLSFSKKIKSLTSQDAIQKYKMLIKRLFN